MTFPAYSVRADAVSGVAEIDINEIQYKGPRLQVSCEVSSGSGTITLTVKPSGCDQWESITDGEILASGPTTVVIDGHLDAIKATSSNTADEYSLVIGQ